MTKMAMCHRCKTIVACNENDGRLLYSPHKDVDGDEMCDGTWGAVITNVVDHPVEAKRVPVDYIYHQLNWDFIHGMARIAAYAEAKYGSVQQYADSRLTGEKSPVNHMLHHIRLYIKGEAHDHFHSVGMQLAAVAYNAMMEYYYFHRYGREEYRLDADADARPADDKG